MISCQRVYANSISNDSKMRTHVRTDIALKTVLVHLVMLKSLRPVEVAIAVVATEPFDIAVRQQVSFELVGP